MSVAAFYSALQKARKNSERFQGRKGLRNGQSYDQGHSNKAVVIPSPNLHVLLPVSALRRRFILIVDLHVKLLQSRLAHEMIYTDPEHVARIAWKISGFNREDALVQILPPKQASIPADSRPPAIACLC